VLIAFTRPNAERRDDLRLEALRMLSIGIDPRDPRHERERRALIQIALELTSTADDASPLVLRAIMLVGSLGDARDVDGLLPWLDHAGERVGGVVLDAIVALDPARALQEARARVHRYARGEGRATYEQGVHRFAELLVLHDEQGVLEDLRAAEERLRVEHPEPNHRYRKAHAALVGYLGAAPPQRPAAAARWLEQGGGRRPSHTRRVLLERHPSLTEHEVVRRASAR
jgi:hypothetical protein